MTYAPTLGKISLRKLVRGVANVARATGIPGVSTAGAIASRIATRRSPRQAVMEAAAAGEIDPGVAQAVADRAAVAAQDAARAGAVSAGSRVVTATQQGVALAPRTGVSVSPTMLLAAGGALLAVLMLRGRK